MVGRYQVERMGGIDDVCLQERQDIRQFEAPTEMA